MHPQSLDAPSVDAGPVIGPVTQEAVDRVGGGSRLSSPGVDRVIREPYRQVAAPAQRGVILSPVRDTVGEIDDQA